MSHRRIYMDHNATTPCAPEVVEAMAPFWADAFANPASPHGMGRAAAAAVASAREHVAALLGCDPGLVFFTSGATESNNMALLGVAGTFPGRKKLITTAVEHSSVLAPCKHLAATGVEVVRLPVDHHGVVEIDTAKSLIDDRTVMVSIQGANQETGTIQALAQLAGLARSRGALIHSDCTQMLGKVPLAIDALGVDYASFSAHKLYGPKGVGALFIRDARSRSMISPLCFGGGQEGGLRPGTLNVPAIIGFGEACRLAGASLPKEAEQLATLRDLIERQMCEKLPETTINGSIESRLPGTTSLTIAGVPADALIARVQDVCISDGSACASGSPSPSHVLMAMGLSEVDAESTIRISVGRGNSESDVSRAVGLLVEAVHELRDMIGASTRETALNVKDAEPLLGD